ncbi:hypothetical protein PVAND_012468 [Polypedilum vanderplanki]|uniref:SCP domain-containing protein n=1 Tax=Polypedilum vanderplanki TaxID=319348 RepID=A0A9J6CNH2_POLVA|nr:hypothetical protein PVAND_012468 [Polypedilum vanderplanki]
MLSSLLNSLIIFLHLQWSMTIGIVNYCDPNLCPKGTNHIACNNVGNFYATCPSDRTMIAFSNADIQLILDTHNTLRNRIAIGGEPGFKSASRMLIMLWHDELAYLASLNVRQCKMEHDQCRNTFQFQYSGQNLGYRANSLNFEGLSTFLPNVIYAWYNEIKDAQPSNIETCCGGANFTKIGHFLQVVQDKAGFVGCAASRYTNPNSPASKTVLLACNYSFANILNQKVYQTGPSASACPNGKNAKYPGLCN